MAKVLQCPQCGHRHPLDRIPDAPTFACANCGRALKVPAPVRAAVSSAAVPRAAAPEAAPAPAPEPRQRPSAPDPDRSVPGPDGGGRRIPVIVQILIWILALGIGFAITYYGALQFGFLTRKEVRGIALHTDFARYWPLLRLVPVWAMISALLVQASVVALGRRRTTDQRAADAPAPAPRPRWGDEPDGRGVPPAPNGDPAPDPGYRPVRVGQDLPTDLPPPSRDRRPRDRDAPGR